MMINETRGRLTLPGVSQHADGRVWWGKNMKTLITMLAAILAMGVSSEIAVAARKATSAGQRLHHELSDAGAKFRTQIQEIMASYRGIDEANKLLKAAGATFQKSLAADPATVSRYTTPRQQAVMAGVYLYDASYAALFFRKREMVDFLEARKTLNERVGFGVALTPKMKELLERPDSIRDYDTWVAAVDESMKKLLSEGLTTDKRLAFLVDTMYGASIEALYVLTETIAQSGYGPEMLGLLNQQQERVNAMRKMLNVFRYDEDFEKEVLFGQRFRVFEAIHSHMKAQQFTQKEVDELRKVVTPERTVIVKGQI
ncbi:MAG: hypothetical protein C4576_33430 [Desulfobacteraceae bacterium]|nr:MAG: hypothetical protein C4576_33430 [Desulfobacteraceae bacterium]